MKKIEENRTIIQTPDSVARYIGEGNPNTDVVVEKAQLESPAEAKLVRDIKEAIRNEPSLSAAAHEIKIEELNGIITLRGNVCSQQENISITNKATAIAGQDKINNQLQVIQKQ